MTQKTEELIRIFTKKRLNAVDGIGFASFWALASHGLFGWAMIVSFSLGLAAVILQAIEEQLSGKTR